MLGEKTAQVALSFGADDIDGTVTEEKIAHDAGASTPHWLISNVVNTLKHAWAFRPGSWNCMSWEP